MKVVRMAYNLYCNGAPSVLDYDDAKEQVDELLSVRLKGDASVGLKLCGKKHLVSIPSHYCLCILHIGRSGRPPMQIKTQVA